MTWQHLQQLRSAARARISQRLSALQPRGGEGCTVNGNLISLEPGYRSRRGAEPDREWVLGIFGFYHAVHIIHDPEGGPSTREEFDGGPLLDSSMEQFGNGLFGGTYAFEHFVFGGSASEGLQAELSIRFEARGFTPKNRTFMSDAEVYADSWDAGPAVVTMEYLKGPELEPVGRIRTVRISRGGTLHHFSAPGEELYEFRIRSIRKER